MPSTNIIDADFSVRALEARTDAEGEHVTDLTAVADRLINSILTEGLVKPANGFNLAPDTGMTLTLGSGQARQDLYAVQGHEPGQETYLVRLDQSSVEVQVPAADLSQTRFDEIYLVVRDAEHDVGNLSLPRIGYRVGDPGAGTVPGPDPQWTAAAPLWQIMVPSGATSADQLTFSDLRQRARLVDVVRDATTAGHLPLTGGTLTGALTIADLNFPALTMARGGQHGTLELGPSNGNLAVRNLGGTATPLSRIQAGNYTGNGAATRNIAVGFRARFVQIAFSRGSGQSPGTTMAFWNGSSSGNSQAHISLFEDGSENALVARPHNSLITDTGFIVGLSGNGIGGWCNINGRAHWWVALG